MTGQPSKAKPASLANSYEPTPQERAALKAFCARHEEKPAAPRMKVSEKDGVTHVELDHPDLAVGQRHDRACSHFRHALSRARRAHREDERQELCRRAAAPRRLAGPVWPCTGFLRARIWLCFNRLDEP